MGRLSKHIKPGWFSNHATLNSEKRLKIVLICCCCCCIELFLSLCIICLSVFVCWFVCLNVLDFLLFCFVCFCLFVRSFLRSFVRLDSWIRKKKDLTYFCNLYIYSSLFKVNRSIMEGICYNSRNNYPGRAWFQIKQQIIK